MQIANLDSTLHDPKGLEIVKGPGKDGKPELATLRYVLVEALSAQLESDRGAGWQKLHQLGQLAHSLATAPGEFELTSEQVSLLKERVGQVYPVSVVWAVVSILEGATIAQVPTKKGKR